MEESFASRSMRDVRIVEEVETVVVAEVVEDTMIVTVEAVEEVETVVVAEVVEDTMIVTVEAVEDVTTEMIVVDEAVTGVIHETEDAEADLIQEIGVTGAEAIQGDVEEVEARTEASLAAVVKQKDMIRSNSVSTSHLTIIIFNIKISDYSICQ